MVALAQDQVTLVYSDGANMRTALYSAKNVTAGDTCDLSREFKVIKKAGIVSSTGTHIAAVSTITGNTGLTIPTGPAADGVWLLVTGVAS